NTYTITGTGTNSCTTDVVVTISENAIVDASAAITVTEFGCTTGNTTNNATVTVNPANITGGTGTYVRAIFVYDNGTPGDTTDDITQDSTSFSFGVTNEAGGNVSVTVFDDKGCIDTETVTIQPFERLIDAAITVTKAIDCATGEDITVKINPDIANASYTITGAATGFTATQVVPVATDAATFTGLATDNYTITITHPVTGCILSTAHIVGDAPEFELIVDNIQRACFGGNGSVDLSFNPVTPYADIYTYEIFNVGGATTGITGNGTGNVTTTINNLPAGNYYAVITMPNSPFCSARSANFTIDQPANDLTLAHALTYLKCNQADSGEVKLTAQGGWGVYEYELVNLTTGTTVQAYNNNDAITGLTAGNYQATVRDANNCTEVITFQLDAGTTITGAFTVTPNDCIGESTATIEVTGVTGGQLQAAPLTYTYVLELPDGTRTTSQASPIFTNLPAGNGYSVIVSDGYSCDGRVGPINIVDPTEATATANITADITCNRPQASVEVTGSGGNGPYMYSNDGINFVNNPIFNVGAGEHQFYVRDNQLCISDPTTITIDPYEALVATLDTSAAIITCNGDSNAVLSANVTGGLGNYEYQLLDNTNAVISGWQQSNSFGGLNVGIYKIAVRSTNAAGDVCTTETAEHQITEPLPLSGNAVPTHVTCFGGNTGSITVNAFDGNGDYEYNITAVPDRPEFPADKYVKNNVFENLSAGVYMITIKDVIGCPLAPIQVTITEPTELNIGLVNVTEQTCLNDPTPTITVDVQGGTQPYFISINNVELATPYSQNQITLGSAEGIAANTVYVISVRDSGGGCAPKALSPLTTIDPVDLRLTVDFEYTCPSGNIIKAIVDDQYKNSMSYTLFDGSGTAVTTNTTGEFIDVAAGNGYTVTATHTVTACSESSTSSPIDIQDIQALTMTIDDSQKNKLIANVDFGLPPYNFTVDGVDMGSDNEFTILQTKDYTITVRDARGCELTLTVRGVYVTITVPNIFTPDGDGINDYWYPLEVEDYHNLRVFIYDRYARKIQNFQGVQQGWDGLYEGKPLPSGDYWYTIYYNELSGEEKKIMGHFTLYR
ncbi:T9SS type B sorting domain-containing protein, partial [Tenacibaculum aiptasiae]